jgi:hypothetical protein
VQGPSSPTRSRVAFEQRPKSGGVRLLCHLDAELSARYTSVVARVAPVVEHALAPQVLAHRVAVVSRRPPAIVLRDWRRERACFESERLRIGGLVVRTDVTDCYGSISVDGVRDGLGRCGAGARGTAACVRVLGELADEGVRGLPVGPVPSAVLANAVLAGGDAALCGLGVDFVRWVDDWWIGVRSTAHAAEVLGVLEEAVAAAGLRLNERKTHLGPPDETGWAPSDAEYHRAADAHAVPVLAGANPLLSHDGGLAAGRWTPRRARGEW